MMWAPNVPTEEEVEGFVEDLMAVTPEILGIDETLPGCEIIDMNPYGVPAGTLPRYLRVEIRGYYQDVFYRGGISGLSVGDFVSVTHFREGNRYEVTGAGGSGGSVLTLPVPGGQGWAMISDAVPAWVADVTPAWLGEHSFGAGIAFTGASGVNEITVPDNTAIALELLDAGGLEYLRIVSTNVNPYFLIDPAGAGIDVGISTPTPEGKLDVAYGGNVGRMTLLLGADTAASTRTNVTNKRTLVGSYHYTNAEEPVGMMYVFSSNILNRLDIGGGAIFVNAATQVSIYTAANTTTQTGTERFKVDSAGAITVTGPSLTVPDGWWVGIGAAAERIVIDTAGYIVFRGCNVGVGLAIPNQRLTVEGTIDLKEQAAANPDTAAYGQIWVKSTAPNELWFTDDAGTDVQLGVGGAGLPAVAGAGYALVSDGVNSWAADQTPAWTGEHSFGAGIAFTGASGANEITVPDNIAIALELLDAGGLEYMRIVSTNAQPATAFNFGEVDIDFRVAASGITDALFVQGSTGFVGAGRSTPEGHLDVYDITVNTTISYYGIHNEHVKTLGATDHLDVLEGIHNHIEFDQNGATIGYLTGINNRTILTSGSVGDGGTRDMRGIYNYLWMEDATCTVTEDVLGIHTYIDLNGGTIGVDIAGHYIYMHLRAGLTSVGGDVFGIKLYLDADTAPAGTVYSVYWEEGTNVDYGIYQSGTAPNLFGGHVDPASASGQDLGDATHRWDLYTQDVIFGGATGANAITVPDNIADALHVSDTGGLEYWRVVSTNANPYFLIDPAATGFLVGVGIAVPVAHLDVYDATVSTTTTYYGGRFDHTKTAGVTDTADHLCGLMGNVRFNQVGGVIGHVDGLSGQATMIVGEIGQSGTERHLRGVVGNATHTSGTTWGDVMGAYLVVDANAGTVGRDIFGCNIVLDIEAAMISIGQNVYGLRVWMDVDQDPVGTVYGIHLTEGSNQDYGFYQSGSADNYFGGGIGIGTATIPHGAIGAALLALEGTDASIAAGPHIQVTTAGDNYPLFQMLSWAHDDIELMFDAYYDGAYRSSDAGTNAAIMKLYDHLYFKYDSGVAQGGVITWNNGIVLNLATGVVTMANLAGVGVRNVVVDAAGNLSAP